MTAFKFSGVTSQDEPVSGTVEALDETSAVRQLIERGLYPTNISTDGWTFASILQMEIGRGSLTTSELAQFFSDLGHLVQAGVELAPALSVLFSHLASPRPRRLARTLIDRVRTGHPLSVALGNPDLRIPGYVIALVHASETSGTLGPGLCMAGDSLHRSADMQSQLMTALVYPVFVALALVLALLVLMGIVVPAIEGMFSGNLSRLSWSTRALIAASHLMRDHAWTIAALSLVSLAAAFAAFKNAGVRVEIERATLRIPGLGSLIATAETARISNLLALLNSSGVPLPRTLELSQTAGRMSLSETGLSKSASMLREGSTLAEALAVVPTIVPRTLALIDIGEATGRLGAMLQEAARDAERRMAVALERFLALLTPVLTLVFGAMIGFVLYAVMTSILTINDFANPS